MQQCDPLPQLNTSTIVLNIQLDIVRHPEGHQQWLKRCLQIRSCETLEDLKHLRQTIHWKCIEHVYTKTNQFKYDVDKVGYMGCYNKAIQSYVILVMIHPPSGSLDPFRMDLSWEVAFPSLTRSLHEVTEANGSELDTWACVLIFHIGTFWHTRSHIFGVRNKTVDLITLQATNPVYIYCKLCVWA